MLARRGVSSCGRSRSAILIAIILTVLIGAPANRADTIELKNGRTLTGRIVRENKMMVFLDGGDKVRKIYRKNITSITKDVPAANPPQMNFALRDKDGVDLFLPYTTSDAEKAERVVQRIESSLAGALVPLRGKTVKQLAYLRSTLGRPRSGLERDLACDLADRVIRSRHLRAIGRRRAHSRQLPDLGAVVPSGQSGRARAVPSLSVGHAACSSMRTPAEERGECPRRREQARAPRGTAGLRTPR